MSWRAKIVHAIGLSALFLALYGGVNALTGFRRDVGTLAFGWEHRIPLVPAMLIPYCSLDLFFVLSFFICTSRGELRRLSLRLGATIMIAAICFLAWPLKLTFAPTDLTQMSVAARWIFNGLGSTSQFNLAPSLHVALGLLLLQHYRPRVRHRAMRMLLDGWFALVLISTMLTHQHHVIDLPTGAMLAAIVDWFWPRETRSDFPKLGAVKSKRLSWRYFAGAATCLVIAMIFGGWMWSMLWPASALAIVGAGYAGLGPRVYRKRSDGALPWSTYLLLGPVLVGTWIGRLPWRWRTVGPALAARGVYVGKAMSRRAIQRTTKCVDFAILDLAAEIGTSARSANYLNVPMLDGVVPPREQIDRAVRFIRARVERGEAVYVHCVLGYSRSVAVAAAYLTARGNEASTLEVIERISRARGRARPTRIALEYAATRP